MKNFLGMKQAWSGAVLAVGMALLSGACTKEKLSTLGRPCDTKEDCDSGQVCGPEKVCIQIMNFTSRSTKC